MFRLETKLEFSHDCRPATRWEYYVSECPFCHHELSIARLDDLPGTVAPTFDEEIKDTCKHYQSHDWYSNRVKYEGGLADFADKGERELVVMILDSAPFGPLSDATLQALAWIDDAIGRKRS